VGNLLDRREVAAAGHTTYNTVINARNPFYDTAVGWRRRSPLAGSEYYFQRHLVTLRAPIDS